MGSPLGSSPGWASIEGTTGPPTKPATNHDAGARVRLHEGRHLEQRLAGQDLDPSGNKEPRCHPNAYALVRTNDGVIGYYAGSRTTADP